MRVAYAEPAGIRTRFLDSGSGNPLLLVHGVGASADSFAQNVRALGKRFRAIAPDLIGHGFSAGGLLPHPPPHEQMSRQILALADGLGIGRFALAGTSYGALVAAHTALQAADRVSKLVLIGSGSVFHPPEGQARTLRAAADNGRRAIGGASFEACLARLSRLVHSPAVIPDSLVYAQLNAYALPDRVSEYEKTLAGAIAAAEGMDATVHAKLDRLEMPVRIIVGRNDPRADWREHEKAASRIRGATLSIYEGCGHMPYLEHASRFNAELLDFLS